MHTTNYRDTFIVVSDDTTATAGIEPPSRAEPSIVERSYRMIAENPYAHTSDDVIFTVWADRRDLPESERADARAEFFSTGRACLRSSDLGKRYGWGIHADAESRVAIYALGSEEYARLAGGESLDGRPVAVLKAMRSRR